MKLPKRWTLLLTSVVLLMALSLSSCKILRGDPRKNCNHPDHGDYMLEQQQKRFDGYRN